MDTHDLCRFFRPVKAHGQLAQLASAAARLGLLAAAAWCLFLVALTLLVMGMPRSAFVCLREACR